jgi:hypothetical protein
MSFFSTHPREYCPVAVSRWIVVSIAAFHMLEKSTGTHESRRTYFGRILGIRTCLGGQREPFDRSGCHTYT